MASMAPLVSLITSGAFILAAFKLSNVVGVAPASIIVFLTLIPTLVSIGVVLEGLGWGIFAQLWAAGRRTQKDTIAPSDALAAARAELLNSLSERWLHHSRASLGRPFGISNQRPEVMSSRTSGSSLYEQVKGSLQDHPFSRIMVDAPIYLMDSTTGYFLRATQHRRLVLTSKPNASCLFNVEHGKTHHWGFRAVATKRYMGQNIVQKPVATSKRLHAWEAFRVLQRPEDIGFGVCSPQVYLILCSARFGKGMWLANKPGSMNSAYSGSTSRRNSADLEKEENLLREYDRTDHESSRKHEIFLSKHFGHAMRLMYSSDLSALMAAAGDAGSHVRTSLGSHALDRAQTAPYLNGCLRQFNGGMLHTAMVEFGDARLGADADTEPVSGRASSNLTMDDDDSTELLKATVSE